MHTITIPPAYVHRFERVRAEMQKTSAQRLSLAGLVEEVMSAWLYDAETALDLSPRGLPVVAIEGKRYYRDDRLQEYRNISNPDDRKPFLR